MSETLRKIVVETMIPSNFKFMARDLDGSVHVFENEPNLDYGTNKNPLPCDMWDDPSGGDTMPVSFKTSTPAGDLTEDFCKYLTEELGDWRDSCVEITEYITGGN